jgi:hypothetical protein
MNIDDLLKEQMATLDCLNCGVRVKIEFWRHGRWHVEVQAKYSGRWQMYGVTSDFTDLGQSIVAAFDQARDDLLDRNAKSQRKQMKKQFMSMTEVGA